MPILTSIAKFLATWSVLPDRLKNTLRSRIRPVEMNALGCRFLVHPADNFSEFYLWQNGATPEARETVYLRDVLQCRKLTIVDVGANAGLISIPVLKSLPPTAHLIAFEPNPELYDRLLDNLELNNLDNFTCHDVALSDVIGEGHLHLPPQANLETGRLNVRYDHGLSQRIPVQIRKITDYLNTIPRNEFGLLKIDVEGFEDRVLKPLLSQADPNLPELIYIEVSQQKHWKYPAYALLRKNGYELLQDFDNKQLFQLQK